MKLTPSALESGASQREQIAKLIENCAFSVIILDGLRPNVVFEYGMIHASNKPAILLRETNAAVDIRSLYGNPATLVLDPVPLNLDTHFSNIKDVNCATWDRSDPRGTIKRLWQEYAKKKDKIEAYVKVSEFELW